MVRVTATCAAILMFAAPVGAQSPRQIMFPDGTCYQRLYSETHLAKHPAQRVTWMRLDQEPSAEDRYLALRVRVTLRGVPGGAFEASSLCENVEGELYCTMEGDAGGFAIAQAKGGAVLVTVSSLGMGFENEQGFATLERASGDDRSFLLQPARCQ